MSEEMQILCFLRNIFRIPGIKCVTGLDKKKQRKNQEWDANIDMCERHDMAEGEDNELQESTKCIVM